MDIKIFQWFPNTRKLGNTQKKKPTKKNPQKPQLRPEVDPPSFSWSTQVERARGGSERLGSTTFSCWIPFIFAKSWQVDAEILEQPGHLLGWTRCECRVQGDRVSEKKWCVMQVTVRNILLSFRHHQGKLDIHFLLPKRRSVRTGTPPGQNSRLKTPVAHRISSWFHQQRIGPSAIKKKTQLGKKNGRIFVEIWLPEFFLVKLTASVSEDPDFSCLMLFILASNFSLISSDRKGFLVASGRMWFSQLRRSLFSAQTILCQNLWRYFADRKNVSNQKMCESFCPVEIKVGMALGCPKSSSSWAAQRFWGPKMKWLVNGTQNMGSLNHPNLPSGQGTQLNLYHVFCYVDRLLTMKHSE